MGTGSKRELNSHVNSRYNQQMAGRTHYDHAPEICEYCTYGRWWNSCLLFILPNLVDFVTFTACMHSLGGITDSEVHDYCGSYDLQTL